MVIINVFHSLRLRRSGFPFHQVSEMSSNKTVSSPGRSLSLDCASESEAKTPAGYRRWNSTRATCDFVNFDDSSFSLEESSPSEENRIAFPGDQQSECSEEDWSYVWKRLGPYSRYIFSRPSAFLGSAMEKKDPSNLPFYHVHSPIEHSWIWKDDPKEVKTMKKWERSYSEFMQSPYYPVKLPRHCLQTKKLKQRQASAIKCRAWLNAHRLWMSKE